MDHLPIKRKRYSDMETMQDKMKKTAPYNIFFNTITEAPGTKEQANAITFTDLLCPSLGVLKCSLQLNFLVDIDWLMKQYEERNLSSKPLTILYGKKEGNGNSCYSNVIFKKVQIKYAYGTHHSKIGIYIYEDDSIRVVVSTANLIYNDWNRYNQGLWVSPTLPRLPESSSEKDGESPTQFKTNLLSYLRTYQESSLESFIEYVQKADFSEVIVFFIYSAPGKYSPNSSGSHLYSVKNLLSLHVDLTTQGEDLPTWNIIAQTSSIGSMRDTPSYWLESKILRYLASVKKNEDLINSNVNISIIYPSENNVVNGYFGQESGDCLSYSKENEVKQRWLQKYMFQWKCDPYGRTKAMPHIKMYCRISPCLSKLAYFLLTSANLTQAAWGRPVGQEMVNILSYEAGVLFLPTFFDEDSFKINNTTNGFPFMCDIPLTPYNKDDVPWCSKIFF